MKMMASGKPFLITTLLAFLAAAIVASAAQAETKIAVIDLRKVFDGYWKTKQADAQLKERAADLDKARKGMVDDYQKANEEYKKLIDGANDQAVSTEERDKRKSAAEKKLLEIKEIEQSVSAFDRTSRSTLSEQQRRLRENILREIRELIDTKAKTRGYSLVLDGSAESANNQTSVLLFSTGQDDISEEVLAQLNVGAPPGSLKPDGDKPKPGDGKEEKKEDKK
jgi:outer membrane protein